MAKPEIATDPPQSPEEEPVILDDLFLIGFLAHESEAITALAHDAEEAARWLFDDSDAGPSSFRCICEAHDADFNIVRREILRHAHQERIRRIKRRDANWRELMLWYIRSASQGHFHTLEQLAETLQRSPNGLFDEAMNAAYGDLDTAQDMAADAGSLRYAA